MADGEVAEASENGNPIANRPYICGTDPSTCTWPVCDDGGRCSRADGFSNPGEGDAEPSSGDPSPPVEPPLPYAG